MGHDEWSGMEAILDLEIWPRTSRRYIRRWLDIVRAFTVFATIVALVGIAVSIYAWRQMDRAQGAAQQQLNLIGRTTAQAAQTLRTVTDASTQGATTMDTGTTSLRHVASTVRDSAGTIESAAGFFDFTIPLTNSRPLAGVDDSFRQQATQLRAIATEIDQTGDAVAMDSASLRTIGQQVQIASQNVDAIANQITQLANGPGEGSVPGLVGNVRLILIWSVVFHLLVLGFAVSFYILATALRQMTYDAPRSSERDRAVPTEEVEPSRR